MDSRREDAAVIIHSFAAGHAVVAFLIANTIVGDTALLTTLTFTMITSLGKLYGITELSPMLGEYDFSDNKLKDFVGIVLPKIAT